MAHSFEDRSNTFVIGISVRTINQDGHAKKDITALWTKWFTENIQSLIPNKLSEDQYNIYTEYESDYRGPYTTVLGCEVSSLAEIPSGMLGITLPAGKYRSYLSKGKQPESVLNTWEEIWATDLNRAYTSDFDVYPAGPEDPEQMEVKTYVSID